MKKEKDRGIVGIGHISDEGSRKSLAPQGPVDGASQADATDKYLFMELGFPILLVNARMVDVQGVLVPDVNLRQLQEVAFHSLIRKPGRLLGSEIRFIRKSKPLLITLDQAP